jgi:hypothetical protein
LTTFCPCRAAARLRVPNRFGSALCLAIINVLLAAAFLSATSIRTLVLADDVHRAAGSRITTPTTSATGAQVPVTLPTSLPNDPQQLKQLEDKLRKQLQAQLTASGQSHTSTPWQDVKQWSACVIAWAVLLATAVLLSLLVADVTCRRPAEFGAMVRWLMLATTSFLWIGIGVLCVSLGTYIDVFTGSSAATTPTTTLETLAFLRPPALLKADSMWLTTRVDWRWLGSDLAPAMWAIVLMYGGTLAIGLVRSPHAGCHRWRKTGLALAAYATAWVVVGQLGPWWVQLLHVL